MLNQNWDQYTSLCSRNGLVETASQLETALSKGIIRPSMSSWGSLVLFVSKKNGALQICIDYRAMNIDAIKIQVPLPRPDEVWEQVRGAK